MTRARLYCASAMLAATVLPASASATEVVLLCEESTPSKTVAGSDERATKAFTLGFTAKGSKLSKISVGDPDLVLDPLGNIPVYSSGGSADGSFTIKQSAPPKLKPLKLTGSASADGSYLLREKTLTLNMNLVPLSDAPGTFRYDFTGSRLLSGVFRAQYDGQGTCTAQAPAGD